MDCSWSALKLGQPCQFLICAPTSANGSLRDVESGSQPMARAFVADHLNALNSITEILPARSATKSGAGLKPGAKRKSPSAKCSVARAMRPVMLPREPDTVCRATETAAAVKYAERPSA